MNTPSDRSALFVKEDGIYLIENLPIEPNWAECIDDSAMNNHLIALASAKQSAIRVEDQEKARELLFLKHCIFPKEIALKQATGIYPIPDLKWKKVERVCEDSGTDDMGRKVDFEWVAVLSPSSRVKESEGKITVDDLLKVKEALGPPTISEIKIIENSILPDNVMVVSSYLFKQIKSAAK